MSDPHNARSIRRKQYRLDITAKAQHLGLCPLGDRRMMVQMESPLLMEVLKLSSPPPDSGTWLDRLDGFLIHVRDLLSSVPVGCSCYDLVIVGTKPKSAAFSKRRLVVHVEISKTFPDKQAMILSLASARSIAV